jgi:hypothetical protein
VRVKKVEKEKIGLKSFFTVSPKLGTNSKVRIKTCTGEK